ncbi:tetratricopeptide repeat protein, partial [Nocardiopsis lucentensis]|uniref:tetratricopeptide repeat protein n=1 Tax=Nocardiopsis lucentensis TaxID=53441 RepID=UPI000371B17D
MDNSPKHPGLTHNHADLSTPANIVQTGALHGGVHFHPPAPRTGPPRQLPPPPAEFTDRVHELRELADTPPGVTTDLAVLVGTGGVGKTALAARLLAQTADQYPDGQLHADLAGFTGAVPTDPAVLLDGFLRALGVPAAQIPQGLEPRAAEFRSRTHGKRLALLLDNAVSPAQVRTLLPGEGAHRVIVTTRLHLLGLLPEGARFVHVRPLDPNAAVALLDALLADHRDDLTGPTSRSLVDLCGRLPLALRAVAGRLRLRPGRPARRVVEELSDEHRRLPALSRDHDSSVTAVFDASYAALPDDVARLYRLLGLHPGPTITLDAAIALDGGEGYDTEDRLETLLEANLLQEDTDGRHRFHDLIRDHARAKARGDEPDHPREAALDRLVEHYLRVATAADLTLNPRRWHLGPRYAEARSAAPPFADHATALTWLEAELPALDALITLCHTTGRHEATWQLCEALRSLFTLRQHFDTWLRTHATALASARALEDPAATGRILMTLAQAHLKLGRPDIATEHHTEALRLFEEADHPYGRASALEGLGTAALAEERYAPAVDHLTRAQEIFAGHGRERGVAMMHRHLGEAHRGLGHHSRAADHFGRAHAYFATDGDDYMVGRTLIARARCLLDETRTNEAEDALTGALTAVERCGARLEQARVHDLLARSARIRRREPTERDHLRTAHAIYTELGAPQA